jgi:hypothetical protein
LLDNWTWGLSLIALTIAIHATGVTFLVSVLHGFRLRLESRGLGSAHLIAIVIAAFTAMGLAPAVLHGIEAAFWAAAYLWLGALDSTSMLRPHWQMMGRAGGSRRHAAVRHQHGVHFHGDAVLLPTPCASRAPGRLRQNLITPDRSTRRRVKTAPRASTAAKSDVGGPTLSAVARRILLGFICNVLIDRLGGALCALRHIPAIKTNNIVAHERTALKVATTAFRAFRPSFRVMNHRAPLQERWARPYAE